MEAYLPYAERLNWHLLLPEFRGPNLAQNPNCQDACGSPKAKQDILDAAGYEYAPNIAACMGGKTPGDFFRRARILLTGGVCLAAKADKP